jgi:TolA-binding protein
MIMAKRKQESVPEAINASLLRVASALEEEGKVHQALTPYLKLIERYPDSQEASVATERVLAIAEEMRKRGQHHMAMSVFDRLETAHLLGSHQEE